jgi:hypothetical protein
VEKTTAEFTVVTILMMVGVTISAVETRKIKRPDKTSLLIKVEWK